MSLNIHAFTSITANYIPKAKVLAKSLKQHNPNYKFHLMLCDQIPKQVILNDLFDSVITPDQLDIPHLSSWLFKHTVVEMCTGVKGLAFQKIFNDYGADIVFYFDPDMVIFSDLSDLVSELENHSILLTPHLTEPENTNEGILDNEICALQHGIYNLGFLGIKNSKEGLSCIDWWSKRLLDFCFDDKVNGIFTDQRWADLIPAFFEDHFILRSPKYNVATWNLSNRVATGSLEKGIYINGYPLSFFHFSGFDSGAQEAMLNKYGTHSPILFKLRNWYIQQCQNMGHDFFSNISCIYSFFDNGSPILKEHRILYRCRKDLQFSFPKPYQVGKNSYHNWLLENGNQVQNLEISSLGIHQKSSFLIAKVKSHIIKLLS
jgi:lipopolysaccharide biosynthesis glycosyltransferase